MGRMLGVPVFKVNAVCVDIYIITIMQFADNAGPDQGLRCPLSELMETIH